MAEPGLRGLASNFELSWGLGFRALGIIALYYVCKFFIRLYQVRTNIRKISEKHGVAMLPHSFLWGHLPIVGALTASQPPELVSHTVPLLIMEKYPEFCTKGFIYLDVWPFGTPMIAVFHPGLAEQVTQERSSAPKADFMKEAFKPITGCNDLVNMEGRTWKTWRAAFNPGFSLRNILSLVPAMAEEAQIFKKALEDQARSGKTIPLEEQITGLTVDIIGQAVLGTRLNVQTETESVLTRTIKKQINMILFDRAPASIIKAIYPLRPFLMRYYNYVIKRELFPHIERQMREHQSQEYRKGPKTINHLAIEAYIKETSSDGSASQGKLDANFLDIAVSQLKIFLLAGYETTASTLCFAYYLLHRNPDVAARLREEHDAVLGTDASLATSRIVEDPSLLQRLPYTSAVLKETLRLYPPIGSARQGSPKIVLTHPDTGERLPTDGFFVFVCSHASHRWERLWPRPLEVIPERWLTQDEKDPLHPVKGAFRPFELGPRNCIGQELAQVEMRFVLALTARELEIIPQYPENAPEAFGEKAYQSLKGEHIAASPKDGLPAKVVLRKSG
ncbi:hypothetical protein CPLU01_06851 [Colletotrichum plurivorum]|uniref:Cytochrome P450 n=1 Tax=Colletotrichum plurivorum TaxID=2175906 RepID=A0A8H6KGU2_9PEZI|nr:hypothetical protein CPLU01_06851 [Colletotrichum plurivorum]